MLRVFGRNATRDLIKRVSVISAIQLDRFRINQAGSSLLPGLDGCHYDTQNKSQMIRIWPSILLRNHDRTIIIFKTEHTLRGTLMQTGTVRDAQQTKQCVYNIPCDCGRCYIGETSRPLEVRIKQHKYNLTQGLLQKSKLAQRSYEEGHRICWNEAKVLQIEPNTTCRKYKESVHMPLLDHPISERNLDISPIWTPVITAEVKKKKPQLRPVQIEWENLCVCVGTIRRIYISSDDLFAVSSLAQGLIRMHFLIL
jgi:hypothetical protein